MSFIRRSIFNFKLTSRVSNRCLYTNRKKISTRFFCTNESESYSSKWEKGIKLEEESSEKLENFDFESGIELLTESINIRKSTGSSIEDDLRINLLLSKTRINLAGVYKTIGKLNVSLQNN